MSSSQSAVSSSTVSPSSERFIGRVKWFNNKAGYGFVTVTDGPKSGSDVFVHHSSIKVDSEQYKYLVQGEYVEFNLSDTKTSDHEFQAGEVCGIKGGKLMCETRRDLRVARSQYKTGKEESEQVSAPRAARVPRTQESDKRSQRAHDGERSPRARGSGPREEGEWTHISKNKKVVDAAPTTVSTPVQKTEGTSGRGRGRPARGGRGGK
jgi:cold shock CspA family protein